MGLRTPWSYVGWSCLFVLLGSGLFAPGAYCEDVLFAFDIDGVLPSSQGAAFEGTDSETTFFAVSGGLLRQDTTQWGYATQADYYVEGVFDHSQDAVLEFRAKLIGTTHWYRGGAVILLFSADRFWKIDLTDDSIFCDDHEIPFNPRDDFHVYRMVIPANQDVYQVYIDGLPVHMGPASPYANPMYAGLLYWGDGSPTAGNAAIEWDYVSLSNHPAPLSVDVDIKPSSCPNAVSLREKGVVTVAVAGHADLDVSLVDPSSLVLTRPDRPRVPPLQWSYADVATPYEGEACGCHDLGADGIPDLVLRFDAQQLVTTLALPSTKGYVTLTLEGALDPEAGGTPVEGADCLKIVR